MNRQTSYILPTAVLVLICACIALAFSLPLYTDEVLWKILFARYILEGGKLLNLLPACKSSFLIDTPVSWIPWRALDSWFYRGLDSPVTIRIWGIISYLCWLPIFAWGCERIMRPRLQGASRFQTFMAAISPFTWCLFPFLLVINRPEQSIVGAVTLLVIWSVLSAREEIKLPGWLTFVGVTGVSSYLLASHPKALFLVPLVGYLGWSLIKSRWGRAGFLGLLVLMSLDTFHYSQMRTSCPELPLVHEKVMGGKTLGVNSNSVSLDLVEQASANFMQYADYLDGAEFQSSTGNQWIRYPDLTTPHVTLSDVLNWLIAVTLYGTLVSVLGIRLNESRARVFKPMTWSLESRIGILLLANLAGVAAFQGAKPFYESAWIIPLGWLALWILASKMSSPFALKAMRKVLTLFLVLAVVSQMFLLIKFIPVARAEWSKPVSPAGEKLAYQMSIFGFEGERQKIVSTALECGIDLSHTKQSLVIDDFTYFVFHGTTERPINAFFLKKYFVAKDSEPLSILKDYHSAGLITRCDALPKKLRAVVRKNEAYCCYPPVWRWTQ